MTERSSRSAAAFVAGWKPVLIVLAIYTIGFFVFYPRALTITDEALYVRQAAALAAGGTSVAVVDPLTGAETRVPAAPYPLGTALLLAPFVLAFGWQGSFVAALLALLLATLITARWLADEGRAPAFSLLLVGFLPALVLGRAPMSDLPSAAATALGLWLFWRARPADLFGGFLAGLVAGFSLLLRETNLLVFLPFFVGALVRRERRTWTLAASLALGVAARVATGFWVHGDALFAREEGLPGFVFTWERVLFYLFALTVLVPGGLLTVLAYRGRRAPEVVLAILIFVLYYMSYDYHGTRSGGLKGLIVGARYALPLLPLLVFAMGEWVPRLWRSLVRCAPVAWRRSLRSFGVLVVGVWLAAVGAAALGVPYEHARWGRTQAAIRDAIYAHTDEGAVLVTNSLATDKFINELYGSRITFDRDDVGAKEVDAILERYGAFFVVFLDRTDSTFWQTETRANAAFLARLQPAHTLVFDEVMTPTDCLRIWRVP
jgi:hypothetical protein